MTDLEYKLEVWHDIPKPVVNEKLEKEYVHALCACNVPLGYSIKIPRYWSKNGVYNFKCEACGIEGFVIVKEVLVEQEKL